MKISEMQRKLLELWMEGVLVIKSYELNFQGLETVKRVEVGDEEVVEAVTEEAAVGMTGEMIADEMTMAVEIMAVNDSHSLIRGINLAFITFFTVKVYMKWNGLVVFRED